MFEKESFSVTIPRRNRGRVCVGCCYVRVSFVSGMYSWKPNSGALTLADVLDDVQAVGLMD